MIRKQVYLRPRQDVQIKRLAEERGTTEADIIREAVDLLLAESQRLRRAQGAWKAAQALMETRAVYGVTDEPIEEQTWTRDELYTERLEGHDQDPD